jgi:hypothetical protein
MAGGPINFKTHRRQARIEIEDAAGEDGEPAKDGNCVAHADDVDKEDCCGGLGVNET